MSLPTRKNKKIKHVIYTKIEKSQMHVKTIRNRRIEIYIGALTNMPFSLQLLRIVIGVRQQRRHVENDLSVLKHLVNRLVAGLAELRVQTASISETTRRAKKFRYYRSPYEIQRPAAAFGDAHPLWSFSCIR